jgi:hypothetical protein
MIAHSSTVLRAGRWFEGAARDAGSDEGSGNHSSNCSFCGI